MLQVNGEILAEVAAFEGFVKHYPLIKVYPVLQVRANPVVDEQVYVFEPQA